jgi:hypothetical protein
VTERSDYTAADFKVVEFDDSVRERPGMFSG